MKSGREYLPLPPKKTQLAEELWAFSGKKKKKEKEKLHLFQIEQSQSTPTKSVVFTPADFPPGLMGNQIPSVYPCLRLSELRMNNNLLHALKIAIL